MELLSLTESGQSFACLQRVDGRLDYGVLKSCLVVGARLWMEAALYCSVPSASQASYRLAAGQECPFCTHCLVESSQVHPLSSVAAKKYLRKGTKGRVGLFWFMVHHTHTERSRNWRGPHKKGANGRWTGGHEGEEWGMEIITLHYINA